MEDNHQGELKENVEFLKGDELRGVRLELDYHHPEKQLKNYGVENTIVVFGSTRIIEHKSAKVAVEILRQKVNNEPTSEKIQHEYAVAKQILAKSKYYEVAKEFGSLIGNSGTGPEDTRVTIMTGGGPGIMEAANRGAHEVGAKSIGLNIALPQEQAPNPYISPELSFSFHYFAIRKLHFMLRAKALVAFPGGYGTIDELFSALTLIQTKKVKPLPIILAGEDFWRKAFDIDFLINEGVIHKTDRTLFSYADNATDIWDSVLSWHNNMGTPLLDNV